MKRKHPRMGSGELQTIVLTAGSLLFAELCLCFAGSEPSAPLFARSDMEFLRNITADVVEAARVRPGSGRRGSPTNSVGFTLICPGGNYPAYWIRDFSMTLDSGFVTAEEMRNHLRLTARVQNGPMARRLANGLTIPPFSIPDHINFDGGAVFYPGSYSSGTNQGDGTYGILPPIDDHYEFIHIAYELLRTTGSTDFLDEIISGISLRERLVAAFHAPQANANTDLVETWLTNRAVGFGFFDTVYMTGELLFPSLLRYRAAGELAEIYERLSITNLAVPYRDIQRRIAANIPRTFADPGLTNGWLRASTGVSAQADVWGTLYALWLQVLPPDMALTAERTVVDAIRTGTICYQAGVRHVPTNMNYSPSSAWERTAGVAMNTYQNGGYWHTPTGWLIAVVGRNDRHLARRLSVEYVQHLRKDDYRLGRRHQAPWETFGPNGYGQNGVYMASVSLPFAVLSQRRPGWVLEGSTK